MEGYVKEEPPHDIYAPLLWRIHKLKNDQFRIFSKEQYEGTINDIVKWYFESRDKYSPEILESLEEEVASLRTTINTVLERIEMAIVPSQFLENPFLPDSEMRKAVLTEEIFSANKKGLLEELNYYYDSIGKLIESRDKQDRLDIKKAKGKLKFLMTAKEVVALFELLRERDLIKVPSDAELCRFIADNIYSLKDDHNLAARNLAKLTNPDQVTISSIKSILNNLVRNITDLEKKKYK